MIEARGLWALVEARAARTPDAPCAVDEAGRSLSFDDYRAAAERCAAALAGRGVRPGTRVSWMLPTWLESLVLVAALARLGAVQNPILPSYRRRELAFLTRQTGARLLLVPSRWRNFDYEAMAREVASALPSLEVLVVPERLPEAEPADLPPSPPADPEGVRWIFYTSGTTADPKGALHSDGTLLAAASSLCNALELQADDRVGLVFPFTHIGGITWLFAGLRAGCAQLLVPVFDASSSWESLARRGVTQATAGTVFHQAYLAAQREHAPGRIFPHVRAFPGGGAPKPPALHYEVKRELGGAGIVSGYGLTECPLVSMGSVRDPDAKLAHTEGRATPGTRIRLLKPAGGEATPGEEGEIRVRGPQLFRGYLDASLDREAYDEEGYLRTGDLGCLDAEGHLVVTGRLKDVIIRKGENISAREVEDLLHLHPAVLEVAVVGLPDPETGERCCAVVRCHDAQRPLRFPEMVAFLEQRGLMRQKIPERLELVAELPRNPSGKVSKQLLREQFAPPRGDARSVAC